MAIDASFYKNVLLLMQTVPASFDCSKQFKKGMFDKPNTMGFIYTSQYLLSVYNAKRFQKMITWPILNKMDEKKYRMEVKNYLEILANENTDVNFPPILMSHLLQAGGTKFLILMWKISQIALRTYIARQYHMKLLKAPNVGDTIEIVRMYFTVMNAKKDSLITKLYTKMKLSLKTYEHYIQCKSNDLKKMQASIFENQESIQKLVSTLPVNSSIIARLIDIEDIDIIDLWKKNIDNNIEVLRERNIYLCNLKLLSSTLRNVVLDQCVHSKFFCGDSLPRVKCELLHPHLTNSNHNNGIYKNECLVFNILLSVFNEALKCVHSYVSNNVLPDLSNEQLRIAEQCELIKAMDETYKQLVMQVSDNLYEVSCKLQEKNMHCTIEADFAYPMCMKNIITSPRLKLSISKYIDDEELSNRILVTPKQGKYNHLFKRYERSFVDSPIKTIARYEFNDTIESIPMDCQSPRRQSFTCMRNSPTKIVVSPRYSRLFNNSVSRRNYFKGNNAASTPNQSSESNHGTPKKLNGQKTDICIPDIEAAMKNIFDLSCKITDAVAYLSKT